MSEEKGFLKPIIIAASSTVLATAAIYYLGLDKPKEPDNPNNGSTQQQFEERPREDSRPLQTTIMSTDSPEEPRADAAFERRKQATLHVWNRMQELDAQADWSNLNSAGFQHLAYAYSQIDMGDADPVLITHINESISVYNEAVNIYANYEAEIAQARQAYMYEYERTQAYQWVAAKYQTYFATVTQKCAEINDRDKTLARMFTERYDVVFVD